jgi:uncharacterized repeat protein (TIGR04138 family)
MVCEKCKNREATVHVTQILSGSHGQLKKTNLCVECARNMPHLAMTTFDYQENTCKFEHLPAPESYYREMLTAALGYNPRYAIEAYELVCEAMDNLQLAYAKGVSTPLAATENQTVHHVSGKELLEVIRQLILAKLGKQAKAVLQTWGVIRTEDFGEIVFEMIEADLLIKRTEDSKDDFRNDFAFEEAFPET